MQPDQPIAPQSATTPPKYASTAIKFSKSLLARPEEGAINYDPASDNIWLTDAAGQTIFSQTMSSLGKTRRAEYALYMKTSIGTVTIMFADARKYVAKSGSLMAFGIIGTILSARTAEKMAESGDINKWIDLLKAKGVMGLNASPYNMLKYMLLYPTIVLVGLLVVFLIGYALFGNA